MSGGPGFEFTTAKIEADLLCVFLPLWTRRDGCARYSSNAGQRLSAKTQRSYTGKIFERRNLARCMALHRYRQFVYTDTTAIVANFNQPDATSFEFNLDFRRTCIYRVFE